MVGLLEKSASPDSMTMLRHILFFLHLFLTAISSVSLLLVIVLDPVS